MYYFLGVININLSSYEKLSQDIEQELTLNKILSVLDY